MKKSIGVISSRSGMAKFYAQLLKGLFGDMADIYVYNLEEGTIRNLRECDLYLNTSTSYDLMHNSWARSYFPPSYWVVQSAITFTKKAVEILQSYPEGTRAMLVNQSQHMAMESISQLYHLGISNIEFFPYSPEMDSVPDVDLAFAPGEADLAPPGVTVVDLGSRHLTANTICEIALKLGNSFFLESQKFSDYTAALAEVDYSLQKISYNSLTIENKLEIILNALDAGIVCVDESGTVTLINRSARELLCVSRSQVLGRPAAQVLPELSFDAGQALPPRLLNVRGLELGVTVTPLHIGQRSLGAFAMLQRFQEAEDRQITLRLQKTPKSHQARYTFADIVGSSPAIRKAREIARRMAAGSVSVMVSGESGTGKELFAQAIHNASARKNGPFIAVNCAALTETLLESELFGYAEGAFTGAKKGGKPGLFECAHQGSLFLDEIETMSPALQAKLLRVLQEREVVRIGSIDPIPVDVRILSSTNEDLLSRVQQGSFRRDLYYRLNVIPLHIPALRERREDILLLAETFCRQLGADFTISGRAQAALVQHRWPGNVRELRNCMEYLLHMGRSVADLEDLPEQFHVRRFAPPAGEDELLPQEWSVMRVLGELYPQRRGLGRVGIVRACADQGVPISEHEVRLALQTLEAGGWLSVGRGRGGTRLSDAGYRHYRELLNQRTDC